MAALEFRETVGYVNTPTSTDRVLVYPPHGGPSDGTLPVSPGRLSVVAFSEGLLEECGVVESVWLEGDAIMAAGVFGAGSPGRLCAWLLQEKLVQLSVFAEVDPDSYSERDGVERWHGWRLNAVHVTVTPSWPLPARRPARAATGGRA